MGSYNYDSPVVQEQTAKRRNIASQLPRMRRCTNTINIAGQTLLVRHRSSRHRAPFSVDDIMTALGDVGIETRPIICGNIRASPASFTASHARRPIRASAVRRGFPSAIIKISIMRHGTIFSARLGVPADKGVLSMMQPAPDHGYHRHGRLPSRRYLVTETIGTLSACAVGVLENLENLVPMINRGERVSILYGDLRDTLAVQTSSSRRNRITFSTSPLGARHEVRWTPLIPISRNGPCS